MTDGASFLRLTDQICQGCIGPSLSQSPLQSGAASQALSKDLTSPKTKEYSQTQAHKIHCEPLFSLAVSPKR